MKVCDFWAAAWGARRFSIDESELPLTSNEFMHKYQNTDIWEKEILAFHLIQHEWYTICYLVLRK